MGRSGGDGLIGWSESDLDRFNEVFSQALNIVKERLKSRIEIEGVISEKTHSFAFDVSSSKIRVIIPASCLASVLVRSNGFAELENDLKKAFIQFLFGEIKKNNSWPLIAHAFGCCDCLHSKSPIDRFLKVCEDLGFYIPRDVVEAQNELPSNAVYRFERLEIWLGSRLVIVDFGAEVNLSWDIVHEDMLISKYTFETISLFRLRKAFLWLLSYVRGSRLLGEHEKLPGEIGFLFANSYLYDIDNLNLSILTRRYLEALCQLVLAVYKQNPSSLSDYLNRFVYFFCCHPFRDEFFFRSLMGGRFGHVDCFYAALSTYIAWLTMYVGPVAYFEFDDDNLISNRQELLEFASECYENFYDYVFIPSASGRRSSHALKEATEALSGIIAT
ncbi:MAG: hypothetical protein N2654_03045 [Deltaproteobacteria bacterium]|nr:hypothetical protein [Deltaproteobacteria bacterium]